MDLMDLVKAAPLPKNATPVQIVALFVIAGLLIAGGWAASSHVQDYFDVKHAELVLENKAVLAAIAKVDSDQTVKVAAISIQVDKNTVAIDSIRHWYWTYADETRYMNEFYRDNVKFLPSLIVPEVPPPPQIIH